MGLMIASIVFDNGIPSLEEIRTQFFNQTGLNLSLVADLRVERIDLSYYQLVSVLSQDVKEYSFLKKEHEMLLKIHKGDTEKLNQAREDFEKKKQELNYMYPVFSIKGFYEIEFYIEGKVLEIHQYAGEYYGVESLIKTLIDLGGHFERSGIRYREEWKKLRKWHEYKWYNRPKK